MNERRHGWIGLLESRPALCLAISGGVLSASSLFDLVILRFGGNSRMVRRGLFGWQSLGPIPLPLLFVAGIVGLAIGTVMLVFALAYRHGRPTKIRLLGCALVGIGVMATTVGLYLGPHSAQPGIVFVATGAILLKRAQRSMAD